MITPNIAMKFENWAANKVNYKKNINGQEVEKFRFTERPMSSVANNEKRDYYNSQVLKIAQGRIDNNDANHNGKMEFDEYAAEQKRVYEKTFGEKLDFTVDGMYEMLQKNFKNADTNHDGSIDNKEMSAVFAYMDATSNGNLDGEISYGTAIGTNWASDGMSAALKDIKRFIFGE